MTYIFYYTGILPFIPLKTDIFGFPFDNVDYERIRHNLPPAIPDLFCRFLADYLCGDPPSLFLAPKLIAHLRRRGIPIWVLGINSDSALKEAQALGATAVLTDRPAWLVSQVRSAEAGFVSSKPKGA